MSASLSLSSSSSFPNSLLPRTSPLPPNRPRLPRAALVEPKPSPAFRPVVTGSGEYGMIQIASTPPALPVRSSIDLAGDIQAEARAMTRAVNSSVYTPELLAARYGSSPIKVLRRTTEILAAVGSFGFKLFLDQRQGLVEERKRMRAVELRRIFTRLGPTFVKIGQGLSTRPDICPPEYLDELSELQAVKNKNRVSESMEKATTLRPHIAFLPTPGMGHLIPISELAKFLIDRHQFTVTIITFSEFQNRAQELYLSSLPPPISSLTLPPIPLSDLPPDARIETRVSVAAARCVPSLHPLLLTLKSTTRLVAFVADLFSTHACEAAKQLSIPHHIFIPTNLLFLTLMLHLPALHTASPLDFHQLPHPVQLPGFPPIPGSEILHPLQDRSNECYKWMLEHSSNYLESDGILVNTFDAIEPEAAKILKSDEPVRRPPVYTVGPLIRSRTAGGGDEGFETLKWLDAQPIGSVLFVSFGSIAANTEKEMEELAIGLENSGQRFLWVVRTPSGLNSAPFFAGRVGDVDPLGFLPEGFLKRTEGVGLAVAGWAPQVEVLGHPAVGGFLTHCGWNSTVESLANGVGMIAWPLFAEQRMNAVVMVEGARVAIGLRKREDGIYDRVEIARVVKELMEGEGGREVRRRAKEMEVAAKEAWLEKGSSTVGLKAVAEKWKRFEIAGE